MTKKILFISHDATRTGAPILLLRFLRWFKENTEIPFRILLGKGGELESDFKELAPTLIFEQQIPIKNTIYHRIKRRFFPDKPYSHLYQWLSEQNIGIIYSNTIVNGHILEVLNYINCPVISHVHELEYRIQRSGIDKFEKTKKITTHFIACANAVKVNLVDNHNTFPDDITVIHGFIPIIPSEKKTFDQKTLQRELNFSESTFILGASGTTDWRKAPDLFIQLARIVKNKIKDIPVKFVWVGGNCESREAIEIQQDILKAGLENDVYFVGSKPNPLDYFAQFDVFVLTSRDDPYPIVCLEAASLGKPIICFDQSGGEPEFVEDDCGFVVPYLDLEEMANKIVTLFNNPELRNKMGNRAKQKVIERHDISVAAPQILKVIDKYLNLL